MIDKLEKNYNFQYKQQNITIDLKSILIYIFLASKHIKHKHIENSLAETGQCIIIKKYIIYLSLYTYYTNR